jgi:hypothetical protein
MIVFFGALSVNQESFLSSRNRVLRGEQEFFRRKDLSRSHPKIFRPVLNKFTKNAKIKKMCI